MAKRRRRVGRPDVNAEHAREQEELAALWSHAARTHVRVQELLPDTWPDDPTDVSDDELRHAVRPLLADPERREVAEWVLGALDKAAQAARGELLRG